MPYLTFVAEDSEEVPLKEVAVTVYDADGNVLVDSVFGPYMPGEVGRTVDLPVGNYSLWARADGWIFPWPQSLIVASGDGPLVTEPRIVTLTAEAQVQPEGSGELPVVVYGYVGKISPGTEEGSAAGGYGVLRTTRHGGPTTYMYSVQLTRMGASARGEVASLVRKESMVLTPDSSGYWEAPLRRDSLYVLSVPGILGSRYFMTPDATGRTSVETLIDESMSVSPYDLVR